MTVLIVRDGPGAGQRVEIQTETVLGRESQQFLQHDGEVSRRHAAVRPSGEGLEVEDLASSNGTFINDRRVDGATPLAPGDVLRLGQTTFDVEAAAADLETSPTVEPAPGWFPDPFRRYEVRYWDGRAWTAHVSTRGRAALDEPGGNEPIPTIKRPADKIRRDVAIAGAAAQAPGGGSLLTEPILVVNQKAKILEVVAEFAVFDQHGNQIAAVRQVGQSGARKVLRVLASVDQYLTHRLEIVDMSGNVLLKLTRPAKFVKSKVIVEDGAGSELGQIVQHNVFGKIRFGLEANGAALGSINAENWRAWNFNIQDHTGNEVARITKTWEGMAKTMFTTADNYVLQIHAPLQDPLRSLVVAAALGVDTALKQDARGLG